MKPSILLVEDDAGITAALQKELQAENYLVEARRRGDEGLACALERPFDVVVTDLRLPGLTGLDLVAQLRRRKPKLPIILMTAHGTTETAIEAMKLGAFDYLLKPFQMTELLELIAKAVTANRLMSETVAIGEATAARTALIGQSRAMQELYKEIGRVAATPVTVLLRGETGTGKELVARALYQHSARAEGPFIAVNCAAVPETLLESELFGHERGAFTGADARRIGRFEQASGGTLFLDEIGDTTLGTQAKLLRVLQEKCIQRVGGRELIPVDVRILTATHHDLEQDIADKLFRDDLFFRLSVVTIHLPALRARPEDIPPLVTYFLQRYCHDLGLQSAAILPAAIASLQQHPWPGNVRQLENAVRQALLLAREYPINLDHVRQVLERTKGPAAGSAPTVAAYVAGLLAAAQRGEGTDVHARLIEDLERELLAQAIQLAQGNQAKAARWLGITRLTLREKLLHFGLHPSSGA